MKKIFRLDGEVNRRFLESALFGCLWISGFLFAFMIGGNYVSQRLYAHEFKQAVTLDDARGATCRVCVTGARGTGFFFGVEGNYALVATNYHVVQKNQKARLDFWTNGVMESVTASIDWRAYNLNLLYDFAIMRVRVDDLAKIDPAWIPLAGSDARPRVGAIIISSGAPDGRFPQAWKGQVLEYYNNKTAVFAPPPVPGQSGSPICEYVDGELFVTGVLTWLFGEKGRDESRGGAIPIANLYKALGKSGGGEVDYHDDDASPIPDNATECLETSGYAVAETYGVYSEDAEKAAAPCIIEFTQNNCPPCVDAETDIEFLRALNVPVYVFDVNTERGAKYVQAYKVERTPTFVLLDSQYKPVQSFVGAGKHDEILTAFEKVKFEKPAAGGASMPESSLPSHSGAEDRGAPSVSNDAGSSAVPTQSERPTEAETQTQTTTETHSAAPAGGLSVIDLPAMAPIVDFRNRPPVYEPATNVGIFEDSDERWQRLKKKRDERAAEDEESGNGDKARPRLKERIEDGTSEIINQGINKAVEGLKARMKEKWEAVKFTLLMGFCFALAVALLIAEGIVAAVKFCCRRVAGKFREVKTALEDFKKTQSGAVTENADNKGGEN